MIRWAAALGAGAAAVITVLAVCGLIVPAAIAVVQMLAPWSAILVVAVVAPLKPSV
ncbi:hypothetical protein [Kutzneria sp. NPDC052558]|uniref:hypothetical protein n=1 Tax=Kutzneria sp. NPDC052558 TaxID=3364121 RepID=UPI0037C647E5